MLCHIFLCHILFILYHILLILCFTTHETWENRAYNFYYHEGINLMTTSTSDSYKLIWHQRSTHTLSHPSKPYKPIIRRFTQMASKLFSMFSPQKILAICPVLLPPIYQKFKAHVPILANYLSISLPIIPRAFYNATRLWYSLAIFSWNWKSFFQGYKYSLNLSILSITIVIFF